MIEGGQRKYFLKVEEGEKETGKGTRQILNSEETDNMFFKAGLMVQNRTNTILQRTFLSVSSNPSKWVFYWSNM